MDRLIAYGLVVALILLAGWTYSLFDALDDPREVTEEEYP